MKRHVLILGAGFAGLELATRLGSVDQDVDDPGFERGASLEAIDAAQDGEPGLLDDILGRGSVGDVQHRDA